MVDLAGLDITGAVPLLSDHNSDLAGIVGHGAATVVNHQLHVNGTITSTTEASKQIVELGKSGFPFQASVGVQPAERRHVAAGEQINVNGQRITATGDGFTLVRRGRLREVSIVAVGADAATSVSIAAKGKVMNTDNSTQTTSDELKAAWDQPGLTTSERVLARWNGTTFREPSIRQQTERFLHAALGGTLDYAGFEREVLRAQVRDLELTQIRASRPTGPAIHASPRDGVPGGDAAVLEAALLTHMGQESLGVKALGASAMDAGRSLRANHVLDLFKAGLQMEGRAVPSTREGLIRAAFSTHSITTMLSSAGNKILSNAYGAFPSVARQVARKLSANDFKSHTGYRLTGTAKFEEVGPAGEIKHGTLGQQAFTFSVKTYARMLSLTRTDLINDDLAALDTVPAVIGRGCAETLEELFWELVLANTGTFFGAANGNYIDGSESVLGLAGLGAAVQKMRKLVDPHGAPIVVEPKNIVCPPELETTAASLYSSENVVASGDTDAVIPAGNPFKGKYPPLVVPHLSNNTYSGYSTTGWYLFGPADDAAAFGIAYLNGVESPTLEQSDTDFDTLGIQFRGYCDFGVCQADPKGAVMAKGTT